MATIIIDLTPLYNRKVTGVEIYGIELYKALLKSKHVIIPIFRIANTIDNNSKAIIIKNENRFITENYYLPKIIRKSKADAVFFPIFPPPINIYSTKIKIIPTIHDLAFKRYPKSLSWKARLYLTPKYNIALRKAYKIVTISESVKKELEAITPIEVTNCGESISMNYHPNIIKYNEKTLNKFGLSRDKYVITVSTIEPRKNMIYLLEIWNTIRNRFPNYKLVLTGRIGWGKDNKINSLIQECGESIVLTNYVSQQELIDLYHFSNTFVLLSLYEGFGRTPLEAYACGTKVAVSNIPIFKENFKKLKASFIELNQIDNACKVMENLLLSERTTNLIPESLFNNFEHCILNKLDTLLR